MSVPVYRRVTGSANQINVTSVYRHTVCNCERASVALRVTERQMYRDSIGRETKRRATRRHIVRHMKQPRQTFRVGCFM